jgi:protoporphyrinogen/coproporphyrinogen III oxidase
VVPAAQRRFFTGCSFSSVKFPARAPEGKVLFRLFLPDLPPMAEEEAARRAHKDLAEILSIRREPVFSALARHGASMPRYTLGHLDRVRAAEDRLRALPELFLAGNGLKGIGLPDCVRSGEEAAERIFSRLVLERGR